MKIYNIFIILVLLLIYNAHTEQVKCNNTIELLSNEQPILNFEKSFGVLINSYYFMNTISQDKSSFHKLVKDERNNFLEILIEFKEHRQFLKKHYKFYYRLSGQLVEIRERIINSRYELFEEFDCIIYKFNDKGLISSVYGYSNSFFGLIETSKLLKLYEYDLNNKIKSIWDFRNPENNILNNKENLVTK